MLRVSLRRRGASDFLTIPRLGTRLSFDTEPLIEQVGYSEHSLRLFPFLVARIRILICSVNAALLHFYLVRCPVLYSDIAFPLWCRHYVDGAGVRYWQRHVRGWYTQQPLQREPQRSPRRRRARNDSNGFLAGRKSLNILMSILSPG